MATEQEVKDTGSQYEKLGVDPDKNNVRATFKPIIQNDFPGSFVNIIYDPNINPWDQVQKFLGFKKNRRVLTQHQDGDGSKMIQRLLHFAVTREEEQLGYALDDALAMNGSDIAASGFVFGPWILTQVINANLNKDFKQTLMSALSQRGLVLKDLYRQHGFQLSFLGGETADLPDQVRSVVFDMTVTAYAKAQDIIIGNVKPGDTIWGFASDGKASWEDYYNSGIMANGLTLARQSLISSWHNKEYPGLRRDEDFYNGRYKLKDVPSGLGMSVSEALMSPTRQWPIVIRKILAKLRERGCQELLHGISINTGGGATKIKHVGKGGIVYNKNMPEPPAIFKLIQKESHENWENMYKTFNCGIGIDIIGTYNRGERRLQQVLQEASDETSIMLYELGSCLGSSDHSQNNVALFTNENSFPYQY